MKNIMNVKNLKNNVKKAACIGALSLMSVTMVSCGKAKEAASEKVPEKVTVGEMLKGITSMKEGKIDLVLNIGGQSDVKNSMRFDNGNFSMDSSSSTTKDGETTEITDAFSIVDGVAYANAEEAVKIIGLSGLDGNLSIVLPDLNADAKKGIYDSYFTFVDGYFTECGEELGVVCDEKGFTLDLSAPGAFKKFITTTIDYGNNHAADFQGISDNLGKLVDPEAYLGKVVDTYYESLVKLSGKEVDKEVMKQSLMDYIKASVDTSTLEENVNGLDFQKLFADAKEKMDGMSDEDYDKNIGNDSYLKLSVTRNEDVYTMNFDINVSAKGIEDNEELNELAGEAFETGNGHISGIMTVTPSEDIEITAPEKSINVIEFVSALVGSMK
ncbi:MAG: hypothetical protein K6F97_09190 [Lachnospiraceae bacterium]|nr:hypothetical protein [Lachnospiraceae bacterium]